MDHVAILRKSCVSKGDNLLGDILAGKKTVESRWYINKVSPWNNIKAGDTVYFKESGCPVTAVSKVSKVVQYADLNDDLIFEIINKYGKKIAPNSDALSLSKWAEKERSKRYCILIFLEDVRSILPFNINKKGFGISSAWLAVGDIHKIKTLN